MRNMEATRPVIKAQSPEISKEDNLPRNIPGFTNNIVAQTRSSADISVFDRIDPMHDMSWSQGINMEWDAISVKEDTLVANGAGILVPSRESMFTPITQAHDVLYAPMSLRVVSMIFQWHQLTTSQIASLLSVHFSQAETRLNLLYSAGILIKSDPVLNLKSASRREDLPHFGAGHVWQLNRKGIKGSRLSNRGINQIAAWQEGIDNPIEWLLATAGSDITRGSNASNHPTAIRHNLFCAELALRAMESCPSIIGAWGEQVSEAKRMVSSELEDVRSNVADIILVQSNGDLVVVEASGASSIDTEERRRTFARKVSSWALVAERSHFNIKFVFVNFSETATREKFTEIVSLGVDAVNKLYTGGRKARVAKESIHAVDARDWFPMSQSISEGFPRMYAWNVMSESFVPMLDESPVGRGNVSEDIAVNTLTSFHTPDWIVNDVMEEN